MHGRLLPALLALLLCLLPTVGEAKVSAGDIIGNASAETNYDYANWLRPAVVTLVSYQEEGLSGLEESIDQVRTLLVLKQADKATDKYLPTPVDKLRFLCTAHEWVNYLILDGKAADTARARRILSALDAFLADSIDGYRTGEKEIGLIASYAVSQTLTRMQEMEREGR